MLTLSAPPCLPPWPCPPPSAPLPPQVKGALEKLIQEEAALLGRGGLEGPENK